MRRAKIVCTIGPASSDPDILDRMIQAGMDVARLNFSHGTHKDHRRIFGLVREASARAGRPVAVLQDLCGPKIRVGNLPDGAVELNQGQKLVLFEGEQTSDAGRIPVPEPAVIKKAKKGDMLLMDDGMLGLKVLSPESGGELKCEVVDGGTLKDHKGINLPNVDLGIPALTAKDRDDLAFGVELGVDYVALSFVNTAGDVLDAKKLSNSIPVLAKMETPMAVENLVDIVEAADGLMVARGDLGVELGAEKVPLVQKRAIQEVNREGKLVITATQMLESMIHNPRPTRAEASDVANAILDGTDALMLSGESAAGRYPVEAVGTMASIIREVENSRLFKSRPVPPSVRENTFTNAVARAAAVSIRDLELRAVAVFTQSGHTAELVSEYRPQAPIAALTGRKETYYRLALHWGVLPFLVTPGETLSDMIEQASSVMLENGLASKGDSVAITGSFPPGGEGMSNLLKLHML